MTRKFLLNYINLGCELLMKLSDKTTELKCSYINLMRPDNGVLHKCL